jgi:hypothetical protein
MRFQFFSPGENYVIDLDCLRPNSDLYTTLLLQHNGTFHATAAKFGNRNDATIQFNAFLRLAKDESASIALTPEYSCPWNTIRWILASPDNQPALSKLWALGCESITPAELRELRDANQNENVIIHFDDNALNNGVNTLVNPLCYVFNAINTQTQAQILILLVQFKTEHMGVWTNDIEQEHYIPGNEIYILRNNPGSVSLFTMICSETDTFNISDNFRQELEHRWDNNPFIILNIQMNPQPSAVFFRRFRTDILRYTNKDIISLNWACDNIRPDGSKMIPYSKSSISFESHDELHNDEDRIRDNHSMGLYYTNRQQNRHTYFLNGSENAFLISHRKPISGGQHPAMLRRPGPTGRQNRTWNAQTSSFDAAQPANDGFIEFLVNHGCVNPVLRDPNIPIIDKERMLNFSIGQIKVKKDDKIWHTIDKLHSFFLDDDEIIKRLTFAQDASGDTFRRDYIEKIDELHTIVTSRPDLFIANSPFPGNCDSVMFHPHSGTFNHRFNLITKDGKHKATVAFIGRSSLDNASKVYKLLANLYEENDQSSKLIVVWYKPDNVNIVPILQAAPKVSDDTKTKSNSINREP